MKAREGREEERSLVKWYFYPSQSPIDHKLKVMSISYHNDLQV